MSLLCCWQLKLCKACLPMFRTAMLIALIR
jgi:hypothetical protein